MSKLMSFAFTSKLKNPFFSILLPKTRLPTSVAKSSLASFTPFHHTAFTQRIHNTMADNTLREDALLDLEDKVQDKHSKPRGDKGRGRGSGGGGGGQGREVQVSKALSRLLRHQAANAGIQLDDEGFARLDAVVSKRKPAKELRCILCKEGSWANMLV